MQVITMASAKGGVGKTTVTQGLARAMAIQTGRMVLAIDLDPQNALALHFGVGPQELRGLSRLSLAGQDWRSGCIEGSSGVYVLPFGVLTPKDGVALEAQIAADPQWLSGHLQALLLPTDALVLLDTPSGSSVYGRQALMAAQWTVVVTSVDIAAYATLPLMQRWIHSYCTPRSDFMGMLHVHNQVDSACQLSQDIGLVLRTFTGAMFAGLIHIDTAFAEALASGTSVLDRSPHSQASHDLTLCASSIVGHLQVAPPTPGAKHVRPA